MVSSIKLYVPGDVQEANEHKSFILGGKSLPWMENWEPLPLKSQQCKIGKIPLGKVNSQKGKMLRGQRNDTGK